MFLNFSLLKGQEKELDWFKVSQQDGILIQNSYPKGGPYPGPTINYFNHSYLVFYTRITNQTDCRFKISIDFTQESFAIPKSPETFMQLYLPSETMSLEKHGLFSYGINELTSLGKPTSINIVLQPNEDCLFYTVAFFYQTDPNKGSQDRGGNRLEYFIKDQQLFINLLPQVKAKNCGNIDFLE